MTHPRCIRVVGRAVGLAALLAACGGSIARTGDATPDAGGSFTGSSGNVSGSGSGATSPPSTGLASSSGVSGSGSGSGSGAGSSGTTIGAPANDAATGTRGCTGGGAGGSSGGLRCGCGTATALNAGAQVVQLAAGSEHVCALLAGGSVRCWGSNSSGQLGNGGICDLPTPLAVPGLASAIAVSAGFDHTCAVLSNGEVWCWGANAEGQLGNGTTTPSLQLQPAPVAHLGGAATAVAAGNQRTCAALTDGTVQCWGLDTTPSVGGGSSSGGQAPSSLPVSVSGLQNVTALAAGYDFTCALLANGNVACWGSDSMSQLGDGLRTIFRSTPVVVAGIPPAGAVVAGRDGACALGLDGAVRCWGNGSLGQLGSGAGPSSAGSSSSGGGPAASGAVLMQGLVGATTALASGDDHRCAVQSGGTVQCWGWNSFGQLGNGTTSDYSTVPVAVGGVQGAVRMAAGSAFTCAASQGGVVQCWGDNVHGQLGDGSFTDSTVPVTVRW